MAPILITTHDRVAIDVFREPAEVDVGYQNCSLLRAKQAHRRHRASAHEPMHPMPSVQYKLSWVKAHPRHLASRCSEPARRVA
jgi:hypothetical protein